MTLKRKQIDFESQFYISIISAVNGTHYSRILNESGEMVYEQSENSCDREDALAQAELWIYMAYEEFLEAEPEDQLPRSVSEIARDLGVRHDG